MTTQDIQELTMQKLQKKYTAEEIGKLTIQEIQKLTIQEIEGFTTQELQKRFVEIVSEIIMEGNEDEKKVMLARALNIVMQGEFKEHINDTIEKITIGSITYEMTALDYVKFFNSQGYYSDDPKDLKDRALKELEIAIEDKDVGGKTAKELGRVSNGSGSESESESELESGSESELESGPESELESELSSDEESEDEDIVVDYHARNEYQTFQQNINSAKSRLVPSAIGFIATTGILAGRILPSIEHEEESELTFIPVLFLSCLNFLSLGLIFDSNRVIRSNTNQINSLLENTTDQQVIQQAQNR